MIKRLILLAALALTANGCDTTDTGSGEVYGIKPTCPDGYTRKGNQCVKNTTPPPPVTQTCWDGSVIPATQQCPIQPPPPPPPITCPDGSTLPAGSICPEPPPPPPSSCASLNETMEAPLHWSARFCLATKPCTDYRATEPGWTGPPPTLVVGQRYHVVRSELWSFGIYYVVGKAVAWPDAGSFPNFGGGAMFDASCFS